MGSEWGGLGAHDSRPRRGLLTTTTGLTHGALGWSLGWSLGESLGGGSREGLWDGFWEGLWEREGLGAHGRTDGRTGHQGLTDGRTDGRDTIIKGLRDLVSDKLSKIIHNQTPPAFIITPQNHVNYMVL